MRKSRKFRNSSETREIWKWRDWENPLPCLLSTRKKLLN